MAAEATWVEVATVKAAEEITILAGLFLVALVVQDWGKLALAAESTAEDLEKKTMRCLQIVYPALFAMRPVVSLAEMCRPEQEWLRFPGTKVEHRSNDSEMESDVVIATSR